MNRHSSIGVSLVASAALMATPAVVQTQQVPDTSYAVTLDRPEFEAEQGPVVAIDAAHLNLHTLESGYAGFAGLLRADGYRVEPNLQPFTADALSRFDILVVVNAMHPQSRDGFAPLPTESAFTDAEIAAVEEWVRSGGSLLLIADHMPLAGHAERLAAAFGVRFHNGFALGRNRDGRATFRRSDGTLPASPINDGRSRSEQVDSVTTFTGQAFRVDPGIDAEPLLTFPGGYHVLLPEVAWRFSESTPRIAAANLLQGVAVRHGEGRVVAMGEAAMFGAQLAGPQRVPVGMNSPEAPQNHRLAVNIVHWLSGLIP